MTNITLSRKKFCRYKHTFVATKDVFCCDKTFVATKNILVAAPANDSKGAGEGGGGGGLYARVDGFVVRSR